MRRTFLPLLHLPLLQHSMQLIQNRLLQHIPLTSNSIIIAQKIRQMNQRINYHLITDPTGYFISLSDGVGDKLL